MANSTVNVAVDVFRIDTFGANVSISAGEIWVNSIIMEGATAGDTAVFIDNSGTEVMRLSNDIGTASKVWTPAKSQRFSNGFIFDDSASGLSASDFIFIYME